MGNLASVVGGPDAALESLAALLRADHTLVSEHVRDPSEPARLGELAASGPRAAADPDDYALMFEAIREGYLLHYGEPRLIDGADPDLRLLTGDYLYALGLERLAARGDLEAVRELADLISLSAQLDAELGPSGAEAAERLWLASAVAVGAGASEDHERAKEAVREGDPEATERLLEAARERADQAGMGDALARAADSIGFAEQDLPDRG